ncbi:MAG: DUF4252 domain-containing protein [Bacteroidaceae bacterium]|nr:DUF4252 domain-containing protein [Bacteroidaceae bacterium]MBQ4621911.1 DUF4252 domain-containing protein [Bacteroidaceae bacterium]MBQ6801057.1 DUF4252 domain-containing protein [Bacteroidaceae bacterium]MBQ8191525.1 DUF4252 domain-containing protein [Bacteroidaceae bacterium]
MKHSIILITIALFLSIPTAIQAKTFDFDKMAEMEGVTSVHISKAMFRLLSGMGIKADGIDLQSVMPKLESLQIITCEKPEIIPLLKKEAEAFSTKEGYEELMRVKEDDSHTIILQKQHEDKPNEYVLVNIEGNEDFNLILMKGTLTLEELQQMMGEE